jgi:hypothetical protein
LNQSQTLTPSLKDQLLGEAKFVRALTYFYLVNLFGDVPMPLTLTLIMLPMRLCQERQQLMFGNKSLPI